MDDIAGNRNRELPERTSVDGSQKRAVKVVVVWKRILARPAESLAVSGVDCWLRVKCVQGYGMSFAAIVDGLTVVMTPVLPIVREFVLYEQSIGKREDDVDMA